MDAKGVDRPVALVSCASTPLTAALVLVLAERGFEVHFPQEFMYDELMSSDAAHDVVSRSWRHLRPISAAVTSTEGRAALLLAVARGRRPPSVVVLSGDCGALSGPWRPDASVLAALALMSPSTGAGGLLFLAAGASSRRVRSSGVGAVAAGTPVTVMSLPGGWWRREPAGGPVAGSGSGSGSDDPGDILTLARAGVRALMEGRRSVPVWSWRRGRLRSRSRL